VDLTSWACSLSPRSSPGSRVKNGRSSETGKNTRYTVLIVHCIVEAK
jgi:hypothetical protein